MTRRVPVSRFASLLLGGPALGRRLEGDFAGLGAPWGTAYPSSLTCDGETGLGRWTDEHLHAHRVPDPIAPGGRAASPVLMVVEPE